MKKPVQWIRCPRCELNWIQKKDKFCSVCKAEMKATGNYEEDTDENELELCPVCKSNYISEGEDMCPSCAKIYNTEFAGDEEEKAEDWKTYIYEKDDEPEEEFEGDLTVGNIDDETDANDEDDLGLDLELDEMEDDDEEDEDIEDDDADDLDFDDTDVEDDDDDDDLDIDDTDVEDD